MAGNAATKQDTETASDDRGYPSMNMVNLFQFRHSSDDTVTVE